MRLARFEGVRGGVNDHENSGDQAVEDGRTRISRTDLPNAIIVSRKAPCIENYQAIPCSSKTEGIYTENSYVYLNIAGELFRRSST